MVCELSVWMERKCCGGREVLPYRGGVCGGRKSGLGWAERRRSCF